MHLEWLYASTTVLGGTYFLSGLDDAFIDAIAFLFRLGPKHLTAEEIQDIKTLNEKAIAIIVPAWNEGDIIERMLRGNIERIDYGNYHIFVGVYPNDSKTHKAVEQVSREFPFVHAVLNDQFGPSSKGQVLNRVVKSVFEHEKKMGIHFDALLMQDAEDLIHPKCLKLVNYKLETNDFIQIPVFSLAVDAKELVAGTYIDEFAESHTKDILVREFMGAAVPSAGVGTALKRRLIEKMQKVYDGSLFNEKSVTEDYELGVRCHGLGFRSHVACVYYYLFGKREYIATREYFPKRFSRSVRQKTRWTMGIAIQGSRNLGWCGKLINRYFLWRDRKGILTNIATFLGLLSLILILLLSPLESHPKPHWYGAGVLILKLNFGLMLLRLFQRLRAVIQIYGVGPSLPVLVRWPVGTVINAFAGVNAICKDWVARHNRTKVDWVKTEHELPRFFGESTKGVRV